MRRRLLVAKLEPYGGFAEWWVADYGKTRGEAPAIVSGPYPTRDRCEEAISDLRGSGGGRCPTCASESKAPCMDVWHYGEGGA